jgi:hypothetical protein
MRILVNGQEITTAKVCILPDIFETGIVLEDGSGIFYEAKCNKDTIITVHENLTGWGELPFKEITRESTKTNEGLQFRFGK